MMNDNTDRESMNRKMVQTSNMNRSQLLNWITMLGFCADDMMLYLDTHPLDSDALDYYEQCIELYNNARDSYEQKFGPLTKDSAGERKGSWDWGSQPLPWEGVI